MSDRSAVTTFLFTDIEGSTRLWEQEPSRMPPALARHDALAQAAVGRHRGVVVKMIGDGMHAAFDDPLDAVLAILELQRALADPAATEGLPLHIRAGLHAGVVERRDNDYFGTAVNRAARIMGSAHGGQVLVSGTVAGLVASRLPAAVALRDLGAVRLRDLAGAEHVFQLLHQELRADFPALRSLAATPNNLPQQMTTFVGREREIADLCALLGTARLLTLTGMGGLGKTRLALEVAVRALEDHADGVWFVELASLSDPARVPQAVASALGVSEEGARSVMDSLLQFVADRSLLVVLDNCEHLVGACAELATRLLQAGAGVRVLATSRENLHVRGETTYPVPALSVPEAGGEMAPEAMVHCDAVRLFVDRALAAQPLFRLTADNAAAVTEICRRLDGIPLALELAAARLRALSVEGIATRLQDRFRLLVAGDRTALPRQKTLRALIDWSHDLLTEAERIVFRRLAVFAGGFNLEAAEAVVPGSDVADGDVLDLLSQLVDKSLVAVAVDSGRYRLLETVRQYAGECLAATGDGATLRARHRAHYVALAERARPELVGPHQAEWLARLDLDRENLLSAHAGCAGDPQAGATGLQLVTALKQYFYRRGLLGLAQQVMAEALAHPGAQARDARAQPRAVLHRPDLPVCRSVPGGAGLPGGVPCDRARDRRPPARGIGAAAARCRAERAGTISPGRAGATTRRSSWRGSSAAGATSPPRSTTGRSCTGWRASSPPRSPCIGTCLRWCGARAIARASRSRCSIWPCWRSRAAPPRPRHRCSRKRWRSPSRRAPGRRASASSTWRQGSRRCGATWIARRACTARLRRRRRRRACSGTRPTRRCSRR